MRETPADDLRASPESLIAQLLAAWNAHDIDRAAALYGDVYHGLDVADGRPHMGPGGAREMLAGYFRAFPDIRVESDAVLSRGDRVAVVWTARGTHRGDFLRIPGTGRRVEVRGVSVLTLRDGKIRRGLYIWDVAGMLRSIGLLPDV